MARWMMGSPWILPTGGKIGQIGWKLCPGRNEIRIHTSNDLKVLPDLRCVQKMSVLNHWIDDFPNLHKLMVPSFSHVRWVSGLKPDQTTSPPRHIVSRWRRSGKKKTQKQSDSRSWGWGVFLRRVIQYLTNIFQERYHNTTPYTYTYIYIYIYTNIYIYIDTGVYVLYIYMCVVTLYIPKILWVLWLISHILVDALRPGLFELHRWQFPQPRLWNPGPFFRRFSGSRTDTLSEKTRGNPMIIYNKPLGMIYHWVYQIKKKIRMVSNSD